MAEGSLSRSVLLSVVGALVTASVGLGFAFLHNWIGLKPDGERIVQTNPKSSTRPEVPPARRAFKGPYEVLSAIAADLREAKTAAPQRRYLTLTHLHNNRQVSDADLQTFRTALLDLAGYLSPEGNALVWRPLDAEQTIYGFDLHALGWDGEDTWRLILKGYPYGLTFRDAVDERWREAEHQVQTLASARLPYARADWFLAAVVRPPLGGASGALKTPKRTLPPSIQAQLQAYFQQRLTRDGAAAELPRNEPAQMEEFLKADPDRLRRLGLAPLLQAGESIGRSTWESMEYATSPFQEVCQGLHLGAPLLFP
jgi:hypothetical protein